MEKAFSTKEAEKQVQELYNWFKNESAPNYADCMYNLTRHLEGMNITNISHDIENHEILFFWRNTSKPVLSVRYSWNEPKFFVDLQTGETQRVYTAEDVLFHYLLAATTAAETTRKLYNIFEM